MAVSSHVWVGIPVCVYSVYLDQNTLKSAQEVRALGFPREVSDSSLGAPSSGPTTPPTSHVWN